METGKPEIKHSPIVEAISEAELGTSGEIRVHLSRRWLEPDALRRAHRLFRRFDLGSKPLRNTVLFYVNLRKRKFAIVADSGIHKAVGQAFWHSLAADLREDLRCTNSEMAISLAIRKAGEALRHHFPAPST